MSSKLSLKYQLKDTVSQSSQLVNFEDEQFNSLLTWFVWMDGCMAGWLAGFLEVAEEGTGLALQSSCFISDTQV